MFMTIGSELNNPFNIRYSHKNQWLGLDPINPCIKGFCNFSHYNYGIRAAAYLLLRSYRKKGIFTIRSIVERFAPPVENKTDKYIEFVCINSGIYISDIKLKNITQYCQVLEAMSRYEGNYVSFEEIKSVIKKFNIKLL